MVDLGEGDFRDLSNFEAREFTFRGFRCASMEGLLQSLKFPLLDKQERIMSLVGIKAKRKGKKKKWYLDNKLYWREQVLCRFSDEYQQLIDEAFDALFEQDDSFRSAIARTVGEDLCHSRGHQDPHYTVLTEEEFVRRIERLRQRLISSN